MWDIIAAFFDWYWNSRIGIVILFVPILSVVSWEVVKRLPTNRSRSRSRSRRINKGKNVKSSR